MIDSLTDETCLDSITQSCCEGGRGPTAWRDRGRKDGQGFYCDSPKADSKPETLSKEAQVVQDRGEFYGPFDINMYGTALQISGMLAQFYGRDDLPILPAYMAPMIASAFKSNRIVKSPTHEDSHLDLGVYLNKARELAEGVK